MTASNGRPARRARPGFRVSRERYVMVDVPDREYGWARSTTISLPASLVAEARKLLPDADIKALAREFARERSIRIPRSRHVQFRLQEALRDRLKRLSGDAEPHDASSLSFWSRSRAMP